MISLLNYVGEATSKIIKLVNRNGQQLDAVNNKHIDCSYQDFIEYETCNWDVKVKTMIEADKNARSILKNDNDINCSYQDFIEYGTCNWDVKVKAMNEADKSEISGLNNNNNIDCSYQEFVEYDTCNWRGNSK